MHGDQEGSNALRYDAVAIGPSEWQQCARRLATTRCIGTAGYGDSLAEKTASVYLLQWPPTLENGVDDLLRKTFDAVNVGELFAFCAAPPTAKDRDFTQNITINTHLEELPSSGLTGELVEKCLRQIKTAVPFATATYEETGGEPEIFLDYVVKFWDSRKTKAAFDVEQLSDCHDPLDRHFQIRINAVNELRSSLSRGKTLSPSDSILGVIIAACIETEIQFVERNKGPTEITRPLPLTHLDLKVAVPEEILLSIIPVIVAGHNHPSRPLVETPAHGEHCEIRFSSVPAFARENVADDKVKTSCDRLLAKYSARINFDITHSFTVLTLPLA